MSETRHRGLWGATAIGVGAIVGGGIMVLAGAAFSSTGPGAVLAIAFNGVVAFLTAMSFAEMSSAFPETGGAYVFAKKVLSVRAAFAVGWVLWFAYIVAGALYALGFATYGSTLLQALATEVFGAGDFSFLTARGTVLLLSVGATAAYALAALRSRKGGGHWATVGKVLVFLVLIGAGAFAFAKQPLLETTEALSPLFPGGVAGLLSAMGFTFIALQGFDLIAAVGGEVKHPERNIPRAMFLSLGAALLIYIPLLFLMATVGVQSGEHIHELAEHHPDTVFAVAAKHYMGETGFWLVLVAAVLSTLSALQACILAASRVSLSMADDRTLPWVVGIRHKRYGTPLMATYLSVLTLLAIVLMMHDLAAAGAASSLIFLLAFALAHYTSILARKRVTPVRKCYRTPLFPLVPVVGGVSCFCLACYQAIAVPQAGAIVLIWLGLGVALYFALFAGRAEVMDARAEAQDPELVRLRGRSPLVLVPIANPDSAAPLVGVASALAPTQVGRVLLLSVLSTPLRQGESVPPQDLRRTAALLDKALERALSAGYRPEGLITIADKPWPEIIRVANVHNCQIVLMGLTYFDREQSSKQFEELVSALDCHVTLLRAPEGWDLDKVKTILVPVGGLGAHDELRARLLGAILRMGKRTINFLRVVPEKTTPARLRVIERELKRFADEEAAGANVAEVLRSDDAARLIRERAMQHDLVILGVQKPDANHKIFSQLVLEVASQTHAATLLISRGS
ncbi:MAG: amino acid permease [Myxococcales bacterium]|nr:MAG: amino acid permease [Myxococcales bacterium]